MMAFPLMIHQISPALIPPRYFPVCRINGHIQYSHQSHTQYSRYISQHVSARVHQVPSQLPSRLPFHCFHPSASRMKSRIICIALPRQDLPDLLLRWQWLATSRRPSNQMRAIRKRSYRRELDASSSLRFPLPASRSATS